MPSALTCTGCRAPIAVPKDYADPTIRCGICWTEVTLATKSAPPPPPALPVAQALPSKSVARPVAQALPPKPAPRPSVVATPAKVAAGMAKLEALIQKSGAKLAAPPALSSAAVPVAMLVSPPTPVAATPVPISQPPVPTPVRVASSQPAIEVQPIPTVVPQPVVVPVALNAVPVVAPIPIPTQPVPAPVPVVANTTSGGAPIVAGELADEPTRSLAGRSSDKSRPYKRRDDRRDEDDDDYDRRRPARRGESNNGAMIGMIIGGIVVFIALCVGGYFLARSLRGSAADPAPQAVVPNNLPAPAPAPLQFDPPAANPNPFPFPNGPQPFPNAAPRQGDFDGRAVWTDYAGDGFKAKLVALPREAKTKLRLHDANFWNYESPAKQVAAETNPPAMIVEITTADVPQGMTADLKRIAAFSPTGGVACKVAGFDGWEYVTAAPNALTVSTIRVLQVGCRVFVFKFTAWNSLGKRETIDTGRKTFFDSIAITFDPATPAPIEPNPQGKLTPLFPPGFPADPPPVNRLFPGQDSLKLAVRIDPFLSAVTFPDRGEAFTIGLRGNKAGIAGELRRYEYPSYKLKNTYFLPFAGTFAVGSDKTDRLAIATMTKTDGYADGERSIVAGDVQIFDLKPIFDDKVGQREELRPLATVVQPTGTRLAGLEISPDGTTAYFLTLGRSAKSGKTVYRVHRADLLTGKANGFVELPDAAWRLRLSADGGKLYAAEVPLNAQGNINALPNRATNIVTINVERWQIDRTDQLAAGTALDFVPTADGLVASVLGNNAYSLWAVKAGAPAAALDTPGEPPNSLGYVASTPDGKRLVTSSVGRFGGNLVEVYDVTDWTAATGFKKIASARLAKLIDQPGEAGVKIGHNFELTPEGKYAVFCESGAVVDLGALKR